MSNSEKCSNNSIYNVNSNYSNNGKYTIMGGWITLIIITIMCYSALIKEK